MFTTYFETKDLYSGIRLYIQAWYSMFYMHQYKQFSTYKAAYTDECKTHSTIPVYTTVILKANPRVRDMQNTSLIKILIQKICILLVYIL